MTPERWKRVTELFLETSNVSHRPVSASREPSGPPLSGRGCFRIARAGEGCD